jgi:IS5 family transposase
MTAARWKPLRKSTLAANQFPMKLRSASFGICSNVTGLGPALLEEVNAHLAENDLKVGRGTIVDATIIGAPSSTKNASRKRYPEMHQTMKGNEWHFGMKAHIGMDSSLKIVHSFAATPANIHDSRLLPELLHADEKVSGEMPPIAVRPR